VKYQHRNVLEHLKNCEAALAVGGDNYSLDYSVPIRHLDISNLVKYYKKPLILWGASIGPFSQYPEFERFMAKYMEKFDIIFSREDLTGEYLVKLGINRDKIFRISDPAYIMEPLQPENFEKVSAFSKLGESIGLNLAGIVGKYWYDGNYKIWTQYCIELINRINKRFSRPIFLVPHVCHNLPFNNDYKFMCDIMEYVDYKDNIHIIGPYYNAQQLKYIIGKLYCFIGSRLHSTIASFSSEIPTLMLSYSIKSQGICMEMYGDSNYCITKDNNDINQFLDMLSHIIDNREKIHQMQILRLVKIKKNAYKAGKILKKYLGSY